MRDQFSEPTGGKVKSNKKCPVACCGLGRCRMASILRLASDDNRTLAISRRKDLATSRKSARLRPLTAHLQISLPFVVGRSRKANPRVVSTSAPTT